MSPEWATVAMTALGMFGGFVIFLMSLNRHSERRGERFAVLETKVGRLCDLEDRFDRLYDIIVQQGRVQVITGKMGKANSPVRLFDSAYRYFDTLAPDLKKFYMGYLDLYRHSHAGTIRVQDLDRELFGAVATRFKEPITKICEENNLPFLGAVLMAVEVAKGSMTIEQAYNMQTSGAAPLTDSVGDNNHVH